jgi:hypothetical protein
MEHVIERLRTTNDDDNFISVRKPSGEFNKVQTSSDKSQIFVTTPKQIASIA